MARNKVHTPRLGAGPHRPVGRSGLWLAAVALLLQLLMPLAPLQAGLTDDGLFMPVCSVYASNDLVPGDDDAGKQHCPLCQVQLSDRLELPSRIAVPAFAVLAPTLVWPVTAASAPGGTAVVPPLPSRGPPAFA